MNTFVTFKFIKIFSSRILFAFLFVSIRLWSQDYSVPPVAGVGLRANMSPIVSSLGGGAILGSYNTYSDLSNPAGVGFSPHTFGANLVYNPWILNVSGGDIFNISMGAYYKLAANHGVFLKAGFFNVGELNLLTGDPNQGGVSAVASVFDWNAALGYSYALTNTLSVAADVKFYQSRQLSSFTSTQTIYSSANVFLGDFYMWYHQQADSGKIFTFDAGITLANFGTKAQFDGIKNPYLMPTYAAIAGGVSMLLKSNTLRFMLEVKKDLVPYAPSTTASQSERQDFYDMPVFEAWGKALGNNTLAFNLGLEYIYSNIIFARVGYMNENFSYSTRDGYTFGVGYVSPFGLSAHLSYFLPGNAYQASMEFSNNFSLGITYDL